MRSKDQNKEDRKSLKYQVGLSLRRYFKELDGNKPTNVFWNGHKRGGKTNAWRSNEIL